MSGSAGKASVTSSRMTACGKQMVLARSPFCFVAGSAFLAGSAIIFCTTILANAKTVKVIGLNFACLPSLFRRKHVGSRSIMLSFARAFKGILGLFVCRSWAQLLQTGTLGKFPALSVCNVPSGFRPECPCDAFGMAFVSKSQRQGDPSAYLPYGWHTVDAASSCCGIKGHLSAYTRMSNDLCTCSTASGWT